MDIFFVSDDGVKDVTFIKVAGDFAEGVYASGPMDVSDLPMYQKAVEAHKAKHGEEPGAFFKEGYAATKALLNAIEKAGSTESAAIEKVLRSEYVDTSVGSISFDEKGDAIGVGFSMYRVVNGEYVEQK
jgi:branched-chain amino acid transport system substrate-binding protein